MNCTADYGCEDEKLRFKVPKQALPSNFLPESTGCSKKKADHHPRSERRGRQNLVGVSVSIHVPAGYALNYRFIHPGPDGSNPTCQR
jgi:hypothetical protein